VGCGTEESAGGGVELSGAAWLSKTELPPESDSEGGGGRSASRFWAAPPTRPPYCSGGPLGVVWPALGSNGSKSSEHATKAAKYSEPKILVA
jgi:hypothetical protein